MDNIGSNAGYPTEMTNMDGGSAGFMQPYKLQSGVMRGTQLVGGLGNIKIDSTANRISVVNPADGSSIGMGAIPNSKTGEYGFFVLDKNGNVIQKIVTGTTYVYDPAHNFTNVTQSGLLPDGSGGFVAAKPGIDASSLFS